MRTVKAVVDSVDDDGAVLLLEQPPMRWRIRRGASVYRDGSSWDDIVPGAVVDVGFLDGRDEPHGVSTSSRLTFRRR